MRKGRKGKNLQRFVQKIDQLDFAAIAYSPADLRRFVVIYRNGAGEMARRTRSAGGIAATLRAVFRHSQPPLPAPECSPNPIQAS
jgi:hypothetical protein